VVGGVGNTVVVGKVEGGQVLGRLRANLTTHLCMLHLRLPALTTHHVLLCTFPPPGPHPQVGPQVLAYLGAAPGPPHRALAAPRHQPAVLGGCSHCLKAAQGGRGWRTGRGVKAAQHGPTFQQRL
jgi:hypothetical protein